MSENTNSRNQTYKLDFNNSREIEIKLFFEPEGLAILIPPKTTYKIIFEAILNQKVEDSLIIELTGSSENPSHTIWTGFYSYKVFDEDYLIHQSLW
jgi:hypothetical protein